MKRKSDRISLRSRRHSLHRRLHRRRHMRQLAHSKIGTRHHSRPSLHDFLRLRRQSRHRRRSRRPSAPRLPSRRSRARRRDGRGRRRRGGDENALFVALALRVVAETQLLRVGEHDRLLQPAVHAAPHRYAERSFGNTSEGTGPRGFCPTKRSLNCVSCFQSCSATADRKTGLNALSNSRLSCFFLYSTSSLAPANCSSLR